MIVGVCRVELSIPDSFSLKDKRRIIKSIIARTRNKFNVAISEIEQNDSWQKAVLGISSISNDAHYTNKILNEVINYIEKDKGLILLNYSIELL